MSCPNTATLPLVLLTKLVTIPIIVVFPAPFGPRSAKKSPAGTERETPFKASVPVAYVLNRSFIASADSAVLILKLAATEMFILYLAQWKLAYKVALADIDAVLAQN